MLCMTSSLFSQLNFLFFPVKSVTVTKKNIPRPKLGKFAPSIDMVKDDENFLPESPLDLLKKGKFARIPWLTGVDAEEGLPFSTG